MSCLRFSNLLLKPHSALQCIRWLNSKTAIFTKIQRASYLKHYPTLVVKPDGSTYTIKYAEPRRIIKLPVNLNELSPAEQEEFLKRRKPKRKIVLQKAVDDTFSSKKYLDFIKK